MKPSAERIRQALIASDGSRAEAAKMLGCSADIVRLRIRHYRDQGHQFPDCGEILAIEGGKALVQFHGGHAEWLALRQLAWVPSGDVIAEACRQIQAGWSERERGLRCWTERRKWFAPVVSGVEDSSDMIW